MTPIAGQPILTATQMRAAECAAIAAGATVESLMARAGQEIATAVRRLAGTSPILILCGPGNNGGDGYVAARLLREAGLDVRVAALAEPKTDAARAARAGWHGPVEPFAEAEPAPILVDALFGTGLTRALAPNIGAKLRELVVAAQLSIAIDLPSGVATDDGKVLGDIPIFNVTLALGAPKPSHLLQPAAHHCGDIRLLDIGVVASSDAHVVARPDLPEPGPDAHKYTRGIVAIIGGAMLGASRLASIAAMRAGAGYVLLLADTHSPPDALVHKPFSDHAIADPRIGALLVGPGLGRDDAAKAKLRAALATPHPLVIDGDALHLLDLADIAGREAPVILTPHGGEFDALFGKSETGKIDRARNAAARSNAVVVFKGADTVIAAPDGRVRVSQAASVWLSTAGTGDVLAGTIAAILAAGPHPLEAAAAGVWLHGEAARRLGPAFIADDLAHALTAARASL
ncbi:NAD(P)H-hydrate dehydratase [Sphingomonas sp. GB1N7]|uniref:NAD(P)H-hydrate dehydratase n=1 Tax=Parasphingomonas caseinilytica TaxID=3096158 RepID=UPI002FCB6864